MKLLLLGSGSYKSSLTYFRLVALGQHLAQRGWQVSLIVPSADKYNNYTPEPGAHLPNVRLIQPWQPKTRKMLVNLLPYLGTALLAMLKVRPELIYMYKPTPITIIGLIPKLLFGTPMVLDLDDLGSEVMRLEGQSRMQVALVAWCERMALKHANAVVVASSYLQRIVQEQYPNKPVLLLSNGVDPHEYASLPTLPPRLHMYYFGAVNRLNLIEPFLRSLPQTLAAIPDATVSILGGGNALDTAKQLAEELGVASRITFTGWIDKDTIRQYVQFADIALCVQPDIATVRAASNLKVFQYMALASVPVVSEVGDLPIYVLGGRQPAGAIVPPADTQALANTLVYLLARPKVRTEMAHAARQRAESTYAWTTLSARLDDFLRSTAKKAAKLPHVAGERDV